MSACRGKLLSLRSLGLDVRPAREWPRTTMGYGGRDVTLGPKALTQLRTTQTHVACAAVNAKMATDPPPQVELAHDAAGHLWIIDGHHALVAALLMGRRPRAFLYDRAGDTAFPPPPRLSRRR